MLGQLMELLNEQLWREGFQIGGTVGGALGVVLFLLYAFLTRRSRYLIHAAVSGYFSVGFYLADIYFFPGFLILLLIYFGAMFLMIGAGLACALLLIAAYWIKEAFVKS